MTPTKQALTSAAPSDFTLEALRQIAPSVFTEVRAADGTTSQRIDFDRLRELLGDSISDPQSESFGFTWVGKQDAKRAAATPTRQTLRPVPEDSLDWDTTQNLYIEGDNLEVLKLLQRAYLGKVKMIYIDPPYNTGNDFVYSDDFAQTTEEYDRAAGNVDEEGIRLRRNLDSNPRYHSDWCSMIYSRLLVARSLLARDGVIFISIDDNEVHHLRAICDEVFGAGNFVAEFIWRGGRRNAAKLISTSHEYILFYAKDLAYCSSINVEWNEKKEGVDEIIQVGNRFLRESNGNYDKASDMLKSWFKQLPDNNPSKAHSHYSWIDENGVYFASDISRGGGGGPQWPVRNPRTGNLVMTPSRGWAYSKLSDLEEDVSKGLIHFNGDGVPCKKRYLKDNPTQLKETVFYKDRRGASKRLRRLFDSDVFPFPKDEEIIKGFVDTFALPDSLILDFFSGSATTAHAVMQLNAEDGGRRKYICVQLPEETPEGSEARKAGYATIPDIAKERIRRAGAKIREASPLTTAELDTGFRVLRLDSSNMLDIYFEPAALTQADLFAGSVKDDRTELDLLFGCMVDWGVELSYPLRTEEVSGNKLHLVNEGALVACFDQEPLSLEAIRYVASLQPLRVLFRERCFEDDAAKLNIYEQFKQLCGWSEDEAYKRIHVL